jgi:hypothetical protein
MTTSPASATIAPRLDFIPGDVLKLYLAAAVLPGAWRVVGARR